MRVLLRAILATVATALAGAQDLSNAPTLADAVTTLGAPLDGLNAAQRTTRITSFDTAVRDGEFAVAYWIANASGMITPPLFVGLRERGQPWRVTAFGALQDNERGSITRLHLTSSHLFVGLHLGPSAMHTMVVGRDLQRTGGFYGWWVTEIPNGPVVFQRSMVHFAPAHPGELGTFDSATGREAPLYPIDKKSAERRAFIERTRPMLDAWQRREPQFVYGFDPEWFDVSFGDTRYEARTDTLDIPTTFRSRHPREIAPPVRVDLVVSCRPMRSAARACTESRHK